MANPLTNQNSNHLWVIPAREADLAVILWEVPAIGRRGWLTYWVQMTIWNIKDDTFDTGQWIKAYIFNEWSDLAPDGSVFIYRGLKEQRPIEEQNGYSNNWVAISRPPYFTALAFWNTSQQGSGGFFSTNQSLSLYNEEADELIPHPNHIPPSTLHIELLHNLDAHKALYETQFGRRGWQLQNADKIDWRNYWVNPSWIKPSPDNQYTLRMRRNLTGIYEWSLHETLLIDFDWVDWDCKNRLVGAKAGCLMVLDPSGPTSQSSILMDFNSQIPTTGIIAPEWANEWPSVFDAI